MPRSAGATSPDSSPRHTRDGRGAGSDGSGRHGPRLGPRRIRGGGRLAATRWVAGREGAAVAADVTDATSVRRSLEGVEVAYYLVHSLGTPNYAERRSPGGRDGRPRSRARVSPSSCTSAGSATTGPTCPRTSGAGSRQESRSSGAVPVTTLRAAVVIGRGSAAFETIVSLVDRLPAMIAPSGWRRRLSRSPWRTSSVSHRGRDCPRHSGRASTSAVPMLSYGR